jgi:hypothetical protein
MKKIAFLSFGHWTASSQSQTQSAADTLLQSIDLAAEAERLGMDALRALSLAASNVPSDDVLAALPLCSNRAQRAFRVARFPLATAWEQQRRAGRRACQPCRHAHHAVPDPKAERQHSACDGVVQAINDQAAVIPRSPVTAYSSRCIPPAVSLAWKSDAGSPAR